jgi:hypothetical protein
MLGVTVSAIIQINALQDEHPMWWLKDEALARRTRDRTFNPWRQVSRPGQDSPNRLLHDACWFQPWHHQKKPLGLLSLERILSKPSCTTLKIPTSRDKPPKLTTTTPNHLAIPAGESRGDSSAQPRKNLISDSISQRLARPVSLRHLIRSEV